MTGQLIVLVAALAMITIATVYFIAVGLGPHLSDTWAEKFRGSMEVLEYSSDDRAGSS